MLETCTSSPKSTGISLARLFSLATSRSVPPSADSTPGAGQARSGTGDGGEGSAANGAKGMTRTVVPVAKIDGRLTVRLVGVVVIVVAVCCCCC